MSHPRICFGYKTALQIMRAIHPTELAWARGTSSRLPDRAPSKSELNAAIEHLESAHPGLRIERPVHIVTRTDSRCWPSKDCRSHICSKDLSGKSILRLDSDIYLCCSELAFVQIATQLTGVAPLLELGYELCGSYQSGRTGAPSAYQVTPLSTTQDIRDYTQRNPSLDGARKVSRIIPYLTDGSASPRETKQALVLSLPIRYGGYGLEIPQMNYSIKANEEAWAITRKAYFRSDLCWPEAKLDVEYQSKEMHEGEISRIQDSRRTNALIAMGWTVICITNDELNSLAATDTIAATLARHLGKRLQVRVPDFHTRKLRLRRQLGLPSEYE